jgi:uncharacterized membrane protein YgcG
MKKKIVSAVIVAACMIGVSGFTWMEYDRYEPLEEVVTVELGEDISKDPSVYLHANEKALQDTEIDFSGVNLNEAGKYKVTAKSGKKTADFEIMVEDTVAPEVTLAVKEYKTVAGKEIKASDLIEKVEDKAGIESVAFQENQIETESDSENPLDSLSIKYEIPGEYSAVVEVTDNSGNTTKKEIKIKVVEDYLAHVTGFQDITVEQGSSVDWMNGITKDEKILEVTPDASGVDLNTPGEYTLKYVIKGDDKETTVEKSVKVTVVTPVQAQTMADAGGTVRTSQGTKSKSSYSGSGSSRSGSSSSGNKSSGSSGSGSSSSGNGSNGWTPGQTWEGNKTGEGYIDGENGNTYEEFTW